MRQNNPEAIWRSFGKVQMHAHRVDLANKNLLVAISRAGGTSFRFVNRKESHLISLSGGTANEI
jgi:hypothetical protein